jgi:hypothetical protein
MTIWELTWNNGSITIMSSDDEPDTDAIESGVDADSPFFGHRIIKVNPMKVQP